MWAELVKATTSDGVRLDGALHVPSNERASQVETRGLPEAVVCLHGVGSNFYGGTMFEELAPRFLEAGVAVLRVNTRGHDGFYIAHTTGGPIRQGAAYEKVDQCRYDINAWLTFLTERGYRRIGLLGHSLGAVKSVYSQAIEPHPAVSHIVAMSPPRLSYRCFQHDLNSARFFEAVKTAEQHVQAGQPGALIQVRFPFPLLITAAGYLDKYGPDERYNIVEYVNRLSCPALFTYGQLEVEMGSTAFAGVPDAVRDRLSQPNSDVQVIPDADHNYTNQRPALADVLLRWLDGFSATNR